MSIEGVDRIWKIGAVMHVAASKVALLHCDAIPLERSPQKQERVQIKPWYDGLERALFLSWLVKDITFAATSGRYLSRSFSPHR